RWSGCQNIQTARDCSWGLGGMIASTNDSTARFTLDPNTRSSQKYLISRVKVYCHVQDPHAYAIRLITPQGKQAPQRINALGYVEFYLDQPQEQVSFCLEKQHPDQNTFTLEGISLENDFRGVQYHAVGVNGATVYSFLKTPKLETHLRSLEPDLVIVSLGTNDAYTYHFNADRFKLQLAQLIQRIKQAAPQASVLLTTPGDCALPNGGLNTSNQYARAKILELAEETNSGVWDFFTIMGGLGSVNKWLAEGMTARDRVHFSGKGYRLQGDLLYDALIQDYANYQLNR
ncbi:MAG: hypothetical protein HC880_16370, partial [Bacteroidia bacterium]|nr:hypothetical protein [Bacteroidia bacterium]